MLNKKKAFQREPDDGNDEIRNDYQLLLGSVRVFKVSRAEQEKMFHMEREQGNDFLKMVMTITRNKKFHYQT